MPRLLIHMCEYFDGVTLILVSINNKTALIYNND